MQASNSPLNGSNDAAERLIAELGRKYLWWEPAGGEPHAVVASLDDLMATKLKATLDRAEAKDYRDIAQMISAGVSLSAGLAAFRQMFNGEPSQVLRAIGYFKDGDLPTLDQADQDLLRNARDQMDELPIVRMTPGELA